MSILWGAVIVTFSDKFTPWMGERLLGETVAVRLEQQWDTE